MRNAGEQAVKHRFGLSIRQTETLLHGLPGIHSLCMTYGKATDDAIDVSGSLE